MKYDIGFLGGGQLARMGALAAHRMGLKTLVLDPDPSGSAGQVTHVLEGKINDPDAISELLRSVEFLTLENEFVPADAFERAISATGFPVENVVPGTAVLRQIQDKWVQRGAYMRAGVAGPRAWRIDDDVPMQPPFVLKSRFGGYDGRGTILVRNQEDLADAEEVRGRAWYAEEFVPFQREVAVMVAVSKNGEMSAYPPVVTYQPRAICEFTWPYVSAHSERAVDVAFSAVRAIGGGDALAAGLFGVELFELVTGQEVQFLVNEIAPRTHNTGHYTMDTGGLSQFEAHLRLVLGLPLPKLDTPRPIGMVNLLGRTSAVGDLVRGMHTVLSIEPSAEVHWYGKSVRPGRKVGHINVPLESGADLLPRLENIRDAFWSGFSR